MGKQPVAGAEKEKAETKKVEGSAVSSLQLSSIDVQIPSDFDSSLTECNKENNVSLRKMPKPNGGLRVADETFQIIDTCHNKIYAVAQRRESITRYHESIVTAINGSKIVPTTGIRDRPPSIQGSEYSVVFMQQYKAKCLAYSTNFGVMLAEEYKALAIKLSTDMDQLLKEGETSLASIKNQTEREKAVKLLNIKYQSAVRRASRRTVTARRRRPYHK